jgi:hypothetical protein
VLFFLVSFSVLLQRSPLPAYPSGPRRSELSPFLVSFASIAHPDRSKRHLLLLRSSPRASGRRPESVRQRTKGGVRADSEVPEEDATPPRADPREQALPWDMCILRQAEAVRPGGGGWVGENACARGAVGSSRRDGPRTSSAGSPSASGSWTAGGGRNVGGRRPNGNASTGRSPRHAKSTPRRNANGVRRRGSYGAGRQPRVRLPRPARGHAVRRCRKFSVTGRGATTRRVPALMHAIAGRRAPPPCVRPRTASASACGATACRADSNVPGSTKRPASNAAQSLRA